MAVSGTRAPQAARKTAAKKAAPKKPEVVRLEAEFTAAYETKGTFRYDETTELGKEIIGGLYLRKGPLDGTKPSKVRVTVEILETSEDIPVK
jgi:hypothetical protein